MKSLYRLLLFGCLISGCKNPDAIPLQQLFIYINDTKEILVVAPDRIWIRSDAPADYFKKRYPEIKEIPDKVTNPYGVSHIKPQNNIFDFLDRLSQDPEVIYVSPFLLMENGREFGGLINMLLVRLKDGKSVNDLNNAFSKYEVEEFRQNKYDSASFRVTMKDKNAVKSLLIANELHETEDCFDYVEVNLVSLMHTLGSIEKYSL